MKYLSKAIVKKSEIKIKDSYDWHKKLWECFPDCKDDDRFFLFRIDDKETAFQILLLSEKEVVIPSWGNWQSKLISENFLNYNFYKFEIKVNPTMRQNKSRRRIGIYKESDLKNYIERKANSSGFVIEEKSLSFLPPISEFFYKNKKRGKHISVVFKGILKVTDRNLFVNSFNKGIGSAKSFGYGMIILQPIK